MNNNLYQIRQALIHREKAVITKVEIKYLKKMNALTKEQQSITRKVKQMFKKDITLIDSLIARDRLSNSANTNNNNTNKNVNNINNNNTTLDLSTANTININNISTNNNNHINLMHQTKANQRHKTNTNKDLLLNQINNFTNLGGLGELIHSESNHYAASNHNNHNNNNSLSKQQQQHTNIAVTSNNTNNAIANNNNSAFYRDIIQLLTECNNNNSNKDNLVHSSMNPLHTHQPSAAFPGSRGGVNTPSSSLITNFDNRSTSTTNSSNQQNNLNLSDVFFAISDVNKRAKMNQLIRSNTVHMRNQHGDVISNGLCKDEQRKQMSVPVDIPLLGVPVTNTNVNARNHSNHNKNHNVCHGHIKTEVARKNNKKCDSLSETDKPHVCGICRQRFAKRALLAIHARVHNGIRQLQCELCAKKCRDVFELQSHIKRMHNRN